MSQDIQTDPPVAHIEVEAPALQPMRPPPVRPQPKQGLKKKPKPPFKRRS